MNKKASYTVSSELTYWILITLPLVAASIIAFLYLTSTVANSNLDISNIKHFTLKQAIVDKCLIDKGNFNINKLSELKLRNCVGLGDNYGLDIKLEDLQGNLKKALIINQGLINSKGFCGLGESLKCSDFKQFVLADNILYILKIKVVNENA